MKLRDFLEQWGLASLKITVGFLDAEFRPKDADRAAAWDLYVELLTRVTTQRLTLATGDEKTALDSVYAVFPLTREILKRHGSGAGEFAKLAIPILNQHVRPFTSKWHGLNLSGALDTPEGCSEFRQDLQSLQAILQHYTQALASLAGVEDLTQLEQLDS